MAEDNDGINVTKTLIEIKTDVAKINAKIDDLSEINSKAEKALAMANENKHNLDRLSQTQSWLVGILITGLCIPILMILIHKLVVG